MSQHKAQFTDFFVGLIDEGPPEDMEKNVDLLQLITPESLLFFLYYLYSEITSPPNLPLPLL